MNLDDVGRTVPDWKSGNVDSSLSSLVILGVSHFTPLRLSYEG